MGTVEKNSAKKVKIAEKHKIDVTNLLISPRGAIFTTPSGHISMTYVLITFNQSWQYIFVYDKLIKNQQYKPIMSNHRALTIEK